MWTTSKEMDGTLQASLKSSRPCNPHETQGREIVMTQGERKGVYDATGTEEPG